MWQYRGLQGGEWNQLDPNTAQQVEAGYWDYLGAVNDCVMTTTSLDDNIKSAISTERLISPAYSLLTQP